MSATKSFMLATPSTRGMRSMLACLLLAGDAAAAIVKAAGWGWEPQATCTACPFFPERGQTCCGTTKEGESFTNRFGKTLSDTCGTGRYAVTVTTILMAASALDRTTPLTR